MEDNSNVNNSGSNTTTNTSSISSNGINNNNSNNDCNFQIKGVPINSLKLKQIEKEIKNRGGKVTADIDKETAISQLRDLLKEESLKQPTTTTTSITPNKNGKRSIDNLTSPSNKKVILGDPKALQLEKKILNGFNFYPIVERLKFDELGFRLVKEYTRFIVVKILTHDVDSAFTLPPPLIGRIWISHILDTNRYEELCKLIELKIHHNPDGIDDISQEEKRKRYEKTIELYEKYFTKTTMDTEIWESDFLLHSDEDEYDDDDDEEDEEDEEYQQQQQLQKQQKQKLIIENSKNIKIRSSTDSTTSTTASTATTDINSSTKQPVSLSSSSSSSPPTTNSIENGTISTNTTTTPTASTTTTTPNKNTSTSTTTNNTNTTTTTTTPTSTPIPTPSTPNSTTSTTSTTTSTPSPAAAAPTATTTTPSPSTGPNSKKSKSNDLAKISIGFIYVKNQKKEVTTFHGVSLGKTLFKVIKAYAKLKLISLTGTKFFYNGKEIMNETPISLNMKDGDIINVSTTQTPASSK